MIDTNIIRFEKHAEIRMKEREISKEMVIATITSPDEYIPQEGAKMLAVKYFKRRKIKVWYFSFPKEIVVKTVA